MNTENLQLPDSLKEKLNAFERRLRTMETVAAICGGLSGVLLAYFVLFISDRFWDTPLVLRMCLTLTAALGAAWFTHRWISNWIMKRRDIRNLAKLVQKHHRKLGDRLLGIVELADESSRSGNVSPALCRGCRRHGSCRGPCRV